MLKANVKLHLTSPPTDCMAAMVTCIRASIMTHWLTYSITAPLDEPLVAGSLLESYQTISHALQKALKLLDTITHADDKPD